jgi:aminoglycoside 6-adenylyltransferase
MDWASRLRRWAEDNEDVRLALLVGSRARRDKPADDYSDYDLVMFVRDPEGLLGRRDWIERLGTPWTSHIEANALDAGPERRVLFSDGQDVDFAIFPEEFIDGALGAPRLRAILQRGYAVLTNKNQAQIVVAPGTPAPTPPSPAEFANLANDYWFHLVWAAKKLRRGELMVAHEAVNGYLRLLLVRTIRWHSIVCGPQDRFVWHGARFFEEWADPRAVQQFGRCVAHYEPGSVAVALRAHRDMFRWLEEELAARLSLPRPVPHADRVSVYINQLLKLTGT